MFVTKIHIFLFMKIQKLISKSSKRRNTFNFVNSTHFLRRLRKHYVQ
eukprot:UN23091